MPPNPTALSEAIAERVARIEQATRVELVVVIAGRSGSYRDVAAGLASASCLGLFLLAALSPLQVSPLFLAAELGIAWLALTWLFNGWPPVLRALSPAKRLSAQVDEAAAAEFTRERVFDTAERDGLLLYVSLLEGQARVLLDLGIDAPNTAIDASTPEALLAGLDRLGAELAERYPARPGENPNQLPDAPRVRP